MPGPDANPARAGFDWRAFARTVRAACIADRRGLRAIAAEIGVTASDLSRAQGGTNIDAGKVMAICDWAGVSERAFYLPPEKDVVKSNCCTTGHVKHDRSDANAAAEKGVSPACPGLDPGSPPFGRSPPLRAAQFAAGDRGHKC